MRRCTTYKLVKDISGNRVKRCANYEEIIDMKKDILVPANGTEMGVVVPQAIGAIADMKMEDMAGPVVGGLGTVLGTLAARKWGGSLHASIPEYAPIVGILGGILLSLPLYSWKGKKAMLSGVYSSIVVGVAMWGAPVLANKLEISGLGELVASQLQGLNVLSGGFAVNPTTNVPAAMSSTNVSAYGSAY